ncbi:unnamed protein product [Brassica rapa subsp. narinosa]
MMFAQGEEPLGVRVLTYQSSRAINFILNALHEDEVEAIWASAFGKLDTNIRIKIACLALLSFVLLSTNLNMKKMR